MASFFYYLFYFHFSIFVYKIGRWFKETTEQIIIDNSKIWQSNDYQMNEIWATSPSIVLVKSCQIISKRQVPGGSN